MRLEINFVVNFNFIKVILGSTAERAYPVARNFLKFSFGFDTVFGITRFYIISIAAKFTDKFLHKSWYN